MMRFGTAGGDRFSQWPWIAALCLAIMILYGFNLGRAGFKGKDERRYAQVAKEIGAGAGLFVMRYQGELYPDKPPLFFWATRLSFELFGGVSPFAARVPMFLSAMAALAFAYLIMRQMHGPTVAFLGTASLALCFRFLWAGRWVKLDMMMCAFTFAAFWASVRILFPRPDQRPAGPAWPMAAWAAAALALLAKGPGALVWAGSILTYAAIRRDRAPLAAHRFAVGLPFMLAIVAAWFIPAAALGGSEYWRPMLGTHVVERFIGEIRHDRSFYYFAVKILTDALPVSILLPAALWIAWRARREDQGRMSFLLVWFFFVMAFFSIPEGKRGQYILPLYPAACHLIARLLAAALAAPASREARLVRGHLWALAAGLALVTPAAVFLRGLIGLRLGDASAGMLAAWIAPIVLVASMVALWALRHGSVGRAMGAIGAGLFASYAIMLGYGLPSARDDSVPRAVARTLAEAGSVGDDLGLFGIEDRFTLYGEGVPRILDSKNDVRDFMAIPGRWLAVTPRKHETFVSTYGAPPWREVRRWFDEDEDSQIILFQGR